LLNKGKTHETCQNTQAHAPAFWLADIINPAFSVIAVMVVLIVPVFMANPYFPEQPIEN
jgi:hypothetical protein